MKTCLIALFALAAWTTSVAISEKTSYDNYKLIRLIPNNLDHVKLLTTLEYNTDFDIWNGVGGVGDAVDVSLSPKSFDYYKEIFDREGLSYTIIQPNLQELFDQEERTMKQSSRNSIVGKYARLNEILNYISTIVEENPDIASQYTAGHSYQGRELRVLVLKTATSKRAVWLDSGIHAREWISPSSIIWIIDRLVNAFRRRDPLALDLLSHYEFHILPIVNPDGYEFTHTNTRLWRKNRAPNPGSSCVGTDLNRNFGYQWNTAGSSTDPCSDIYGGSSASSELETQALQNAISKHQGKWDVYVNIHTYGCIWMPIWSYTTTLPDHYDDLLAVSKIGVDALKAVYGTQFVIGSPANIFSPTGGGTIDWVHQIGGVKYAFGLELRPGQSGTDSLYGFVLPEDRIPLAGEETYQGLMAMIAAVKERNLKQAN